MQFTLLVALALLLGMSGIRPGRPSYLLVAAAALAAGASIYLGG